MKRLEFYFVLFGIGIGVFISGVIVNAFPIPHVEYTDEEIRERARDLGMIGLRESIEGNLESSDEAEEDDSHESAQSIDEDEVNEVVEIAIDIGEGTVVVSQKLYDADIIDDASEFQDFVASKGAGNKLRVGTYSIKKGSDFESILSIITKGAF